MLEIDPNVEEDGGCRKEMLEEEGESGFAVVSEGVVVAREGAGVCPVPCPFNPDDV